ncbi:MAG: diguanylate cyclase [Desulfuromonadales bacterium]|nr:diguanylate cyclase [Desulfuromonadales bacterium]
MKLCIPVESNEGLNSLVYGHFGSAPMFVVIDTETSELTEIVNRDLHHAHGACSPLKALGGILIDAIIVGGIGAGALMGLNRAGLQVYKAQGVNVADNLTCLGMGLLPELSPDQVCGGHDHGHGCGH